MVFLAAALNTRPLRAVSEARLVEPSATFRLLLKTETDCTPEAFSNSPGTSSDSTLGITILKSRWAEARSVVPAAPEAICESAAARNGNSNAAQPAEAARAARQPNLNAVFKPLN